MNVLHVTGPARFGGIERLVLDLANVQHHTPGMSTGVLFTNTEGEFIEKFAQKKLTCYSAGLAGGYDVSPNKYRKVLDLFRQYQVLHFHGFNPLLATCAAASGKPVVYTEHGNFAIGRKTGIAGAVKSALLSVFLNRFADYVTFNSGFTRGIAEARYGLQDTPGSVVYNGIAVDEIAGSTRPIDPAIAGKLESRFVVGTSSRFAGFKRIDRLIDAFATFQHGKPDAMLLLVGDGALRADLERQVEGHRISEKTIFTGYRNNVADYQDSMDVCVFPSASEPFGLAAVETLLLGKPTIICHDGGGLVEVVGGLSPADVVNGVGGIAERLEYYYRNRDGIGAGAAARKGYASKFSIEETAAAFLRIYQNVVTGKTRSSHVRN
jgi:glycosyltransferase involved in cell wall biosynthesis